MKVLIVGGVAGGASTAARLRRQDEQADIIMFERGEFISYASCGLPYYLSNTIDKQEKLVVMSPERFKGLLNVEVRIKSEVVEINRENKSIKVKNLETGEEYEEEYDKLVLSPGANPFIPPTPGIDGENIFTVRTVNDAENIKSLVKEGKKAIVIGGGFIGVEVAENLTEAGVQTSIIEMSEQLLPPLDYEISAQIHNHLRDKNVTLYLKNAIEKFENKDGKVIAKLKNGETIESDFVILAIGVKPENDLAVKAELEVGPRGHILVNDNLRTEDESIYALGDAIEVVDFNTKEKTAIPLAGPANKQGRIVADNIAGIKTKFNGTQGTAILKVFDLDVASTGLNEKTLKNKNIEYLKTYTYGFSHAIYYPNAMPLMIKLLFSPTTKKILGAQVIGKGSVDKAIDVIATTIRLGGNIESLVEAELAYAPPFGNAKDPVNISAMSAQNILAGTVKPCYEEEIVSINENSVFLDVRTNDERVMGNIANDIHIPIGELRGRLEELPKDKEIITYCVKGLKSYFASLVLKQNGFENVRSLNGGYVLHKQILRNNQEGIKEYSIISKNSEVEGDVKIEAQGLCCHSPISKLSDSIKEVGQGKVVEITTNDGNFKHDIVTWAKKTGHEIVHLVSENRIIKAKIKKK